jgi:hypothetical protein
LLDSKVTPLTFGAAVRAAVVTMMDAKVGTVALAGLFMVVAVVVPVIMTTLVAQA